MKTVPAVIKTAEMKRWKHREDGGGRERFNFILLLHFLFYLITDVMDVWKNEVKH